MLRGLVRETAPEVEELISYDMPVFKGRGVFAWILSSKRDVTFSFKDGVHFDDPHRLLLGSGKHARHIKLKPGAEVDRETLRFYLRQAVARDAEAG
jgi:hypothetical protein